MNKKLLIELIMGAGLLSIIGGGIYLRSAANPDTQIDAHAQTISITVLGPIDTLDSTKYTSSINSDILTNTNVGLYRYNAKNKVVAGLITGAPTINATKKVYTYTLRHTQWANGDPVVAADFVYAWRKLANPATSSRNASRMDIIQNGAKVRTGLLDPDALGVKALGKYKLQVTLENQLPYLETTLASVPFMPIDANFAGKLGAKYGTSTATTVSNGPYTVVNWHASTDTRWKFVKNNRYYNKAAYKIKTVHVRQIADVETGAKLFEHHQVDFTQLDSKYEKYYIGYRLLHEQSLPMIGQMLFNTNNTLTGNIHLRKAIAQAFNKDLLTNGTVNSGSTPLNGLIPANIVSNPTTGIDYRKSTGDLLPYNLVKARSEWAQAKKELNRNSMTLPLNIADNSQAAIVAKFLKSQLEHNLPGLTIKVETTPLEERTAIEMSGKFSLIYSTWALSDSDPFDMLKFYQTGSKLNVSNFSSMRYDRMLNHISRDLTADTPERWAALQRAERYLIDKEVPVTGMLQTGVSYLLTTRVNKIPLLPSGLPNLRYTTLH